MPTYSYVCKECGHAFDIQQAFTDDTLTDCPQCAGALRKIFSAVGVVFKGSGFYRTDSAADRKKKDSASTGSSEGSSSSSSEGSKSSSDSGSSTSGGDSGKSGAAKSSSGSSTPSPAAAS